MPQVKVQDSEGREQIIIGGAVIGLGINSNAYVAKFVSREPEDVPRLISATIKYFLDQYPEELREALKKYDL